MAIGRKEAGLTFDRLNMPHVSVYRACVVASNPAQLFRLVGGFAVLVPADA